MLLHRNILEYSSTAWGFPIHARWLDEGYSNLAYRYPLVNSIDISDRARMQISGETIQWLANMHWANRQALFLGPDG
jgi:hypothetical protein